MRQHGPTRPHHHYIGRNSDEPCVSVLCWLVIDTGLVYFHSCVQPEVRA